MSDGCGDNLKKVFKSIKDFKFRKAKDEQKLMMEQSNCLIEGIKEEEKFTGLEKIRSETTRHDFEASSRKKYEFVLKNVQSSTKHTEEAGRFSVT